MRYAFWDKTLAFVGEPAPESVAAASVPTLFEIPLDNSPNQTFQATIEIDGKNVSFEFSLNYNEMAGYWMMKLMNQASSAVILDCVPLVPGAFPSANILAQYAYLRIGSAYVYKAGKSPLDYPNNNGLGDNFLLIWGDTPNG